MTAPAASRLTAAEQHQVHAATAFAHAYDGGQAALARFLGCPDDTYMWPQAAGYAAQSLRDLLAVAARLDGQR